MTAILEDEHPRLLGEQVVLRRPREVEIEGRLRMHSDPADQAGS